jgi:hypothetical protein
MKVARTFPALLLFAIATSAIAQEDLPAQPRRDFRYSLAVINDATVDSNLCPPLPASLSQLLNNPSFTLFQNQFLLEPAFTLRYRSRWSFASSVVGIGETFRGISAADFNIPPSTVFPASSSSTELNAYTGTHAHLLVKEAYAGLSAGDFDFTLGRRMVRWGTGYAFIATGVLDPPRDPANPTDRLNLNQGRDMIKVDFVHGPHAFSLAWSSAALAPAGTNLHDTTAFRYNILVHGFDTSLIAGDDRGGDAFGGLTFTRVFGQAWEMHGEVAWREQGALLLGGKYTAKSGISVIGEFFTPPNIPYYWDGMVSPLAGRQRYAFLRVSKSRLRELPGWKQWDASAGMVANVKDGSFIAIFDTTRRFGNHFSAYLHLEVPSGSKTSDYGAIPYSAATSAGVKFQL